MSFAIRLLASALLLLLLIAAAARNQSIAAPLPPSPSVAGAR
jgi:hypothetical protein